MRETNIMSDIVLYGERIKNFDLDVSTDEEEEKA
jgi:hypothetical protein